MNFQILKICDKLSVEETDLGIRKISPVWACDFSANEFFDLQRPKVERSRGLLLPGELGCALAHKKAYEEIVSCGLPSLILEDDVSISLDQLRVIRAVLDSVRNPDFIHFAKYPYDFELCQIAPNIYVPDTTKSFWGAAAYFVSVRMAQFLLDRHSEFPEKADNWREFFSACDFIPLYSHVFDHDSSSSKIMDRSIDRSKLSQNPSIFSALRLRFGIFRMILLSGVRRRLHIKRARNML